MLPSEKAEIGKIKRESSATHCLGNCLHCRDNAQSIAPGSVAYNTKLLSQKCIGSGISIIGPSFCLPATIVHTCFD